jgi:myotubularin-related protein 6/7/8
MGIPDAHWRVSSSNQFYKLCSSYPRVIVVPGKISDSQLKEVEQKRDRGKGDQGGSKKEREDERKEGEANL